MQPLLCFHTMLSHSVASAQLVVACSTNHGWNLGGLMQNIELNPYLSSNLFNFFDRKRDHWNSASYSYNKKVDWQFKNFQDNFFSNHPIETFNLKKKNGFLTKHKFRITSLAKRARGNSSQVAGWPLIIKKKINLARKEIPLFHKDHID